MEWKRVQGSQEEMPIEMDNTSSKIYIYLRKNIERVTVENETDGTTSELWEYDEAKLTHNEYLIYQAAQNRADIEYIAAVNDIEL